jgi:hypothetical protein
MGVIAIVLLSGCGSLVFVVRCCSIGVGRNDARTVDTVDEYEYSSLPLPTTKYNHGSRSFAHGSGSFLAVVYQMMNPAPLYVSL